jgi:hypothetical protein
LPTRIAILTTEKFGGFYGNFLSRGLNHPVEAYKLTGETNATPNVAETAPWPKLRFFGEPVQDLPSSQFRSGTTFD